MSIRRAMFALLTAWLAIAASPAAASETLVAVAANFAEPARAIAERFRAKTGHEAVLSVGPSGAFYAQIVQGAPFDVLLSADAERPAALEREGLGVRGTRFTYAVGRLVLYSADPKLVDPSGAVLAKAAFRKLAIADPAAAPYGRAAVEVLRTRGLESKIRPRLVTAASVGQAMQFVESGAADLGFVARSQVSDRPGGSRWMVPAREHAPIVQQAILLKRGADDPAARAFAAFLRGAEARAIIRRYGYETPR